MAKSYLTDDQIYHDAQIIKTMSAPMPIKIRMLSELFAGYEDIWQVVGITKRALLKFKSVEYKRPSRIGINRAHLNDKYITYKVLLEGNLSKDDWWIYFKKNNITVLALAEENKNIAKAPPEEIIKIPQIGLFKSQSFSWRHGKEERDFLKKIYEENFN